MAPTPKPNHPRKRHTGRRQRAHQSTTLIKLSTLLLPTLAQSVSLSEFLPSINPSTLTPDCSTIYTSTIPTCTPTDFSGRCSSGCIDALVALYSPIYSSCGSSANNNQLLIGNFLAGNALSILCHGVVVVTMNPTSAMTAAPESSQVAVASSTVQSGPVPSSRAASSQAPNSSKQSATLYQSSGLDFPAYDSSTVPLPSSSSSTAKIHTTSTLTTEITSTVHSTHTEQTVHPHTSKISRTSSSPTSTTTENAPTGTPTTAEQYSHCVEYESNPFKSCGEDQGSGADALRASLWRVGGLVLGGVLSAFVVARGEL